jgi:hypothetical protein
MSDPPGGQCIAAGGDNVRACGPRGPRHPNRLWVTGSLGTTPFGEFKQTDTLLFYGITVIKL